MQTAVPLNGCFRYRYPHKTRARPVRLLTRLVRVPPCDTRTLLVGSTPVLPSLYPAMSLVISRVTPPGQSPYVQKMVVPPPPPSGTHTRGAGATREVANPPCSPPPPPHACARGPRVHEAPLVVPWHPADRTLPRLRASQGSLRGAPPLLFLHFTGPCVCVASNPAERSSSR